MFASEKQQKKKIGAETADLYVNRVLITFIRPPIILMMTVKLNEKFSIMSGGSSSLEKRRKLLMKSENVFDEEGNIFPSRKFAGPKQSNDFYICQKVKRRA